MYIFYTKVIQKWTQMFKSEKYYEMSDYKK